MKSSSIYLSGGENATISRVRSSDGRAAKIAMVFLALILAAVSVFGTFRAAEPSEVSALSSDSYQEVNAGKFGFLCDGIGYNMNSKGNWKNMFMAYPAMDATGRQVSMQEAFSYNLRLVNYYGEGGKDQTFVKESPDNRYSGIGKVGDQKDKMNGLRSVGTCGVGSLITASTNVVFGMSSIFTGLTQAVTNWAFNPGIICKSPDSSGESCINLLRVIGGGSGDRGGLIGALKNGFFIPLLAIVISVVGIAILVKTIRTRAFAKGFGALAWIFISAISGWAILSFPAQIASAPMKVNNTLVSCVVGSMSGNNCSGSTTADPAIKGTPDKVCSIAASGARKSDELPMVVSSMNCKIWKAFVLEPYSQASFGKSYEQMETSNADTKAAIEKAGLSADDFKVGLGASDKLSAYDGKTLKLDSNNKSVSNVAAYQLYLMTNATQGEQANKTPDGYDKNWYKIVGVAANNDATWSSWTWNGGSGFQKMGIAFLSLFSSVIGGALLILISLLALMYYISSVIIMAFAAVFLLLAVDPYVGRRAFMGWLSTLIAQILKYIMSALFLMIAIAVYDGVLGSVTNIASSFVILLILTLAILASRFQIMKLLGALNLSGRDIKTGFDRERMGQRAESIKRIGRGVTAGAAVGAIDSAGTGFKGMGKSIASGASRGVGNQLRRSNSSIGEMVRTKDALHADTKSDLAQEAKAAETKVGRDMSTADELNKRHDEAKEGVAQAAEDYQDTKDKRDELKGNVEAVHKMQDEVLVKMADGDLPNGVGKDAASDYGAVKNIEMDIKAAEAQGLDTSDLVAQLTAAQNKLGGHGLNFQQTQALQGAYDRAFGDLKESEGLARNYTPDYARLARLSSKLDQDKMTYAAMLKEVNDIGAKAQEATSVAWATNLKAEQLQDAHIALSPGDNFSVRRYKKVMDSARTDMFNYEKELSEKSMSRYIAPENIEDVDIDSYKDPSYKHTASEVAMQQWNSEMAQRPRRSRVRNFISGKKDEQPEVADNFTPMASRKQSDSAQASTEQTVEMPKFSEDSVATKRVDNVGAPIAEEKSEPSESSIGGTVRSSKDDTGDRQDRSESDSYVDNSSRKATEEMPPVQRDDSSSKSASKPEETARRDSKAAEPKVEPVVNGEEPRREKRTSSERKTTTGRARRRDKKLETAPERRSEPITRRSANASDSDTNDSDGGPRKLSGDDSGAARRRR